MKYVLKNAVLTSCAVLLFAACATTSKPMTHLQITELLDKMPADTIDDRDAAAEYFLASGETTITSLFQQVVPTGEGDDMAVRTALNGIAKYASRPGAIQQRQIFENGALAALPTLKSDEAKAFTIRQLEVAGSNASVDTLGGYLGDMVLAQPAITVLQLIGSQEAANTLGSALSTTEDIVIATAIIKALGELRHNPSVDTITHFASLSDHSLRFTALYALANIADPIRNDTKGRSEVQQGLRSDRSRVNSCTVQSPACRQIARSSPP